MSSHTQQRGRPSGLTSRTEDLLLRAVRRGLPYKQAAALAGISYMTLNRWRKAGAEEDAPAEFRDFCDRLARAEAEAADALLEIITKAGRERDWKAAAWILERRFRRDMEKDEEAAIKPLFTRMHEDLGIF